MEEGSGSVFSHIDANLPSSHEAGHLPFPCSTTSFINQVPSWPGCFWLCSAPRCYLHTARLLLWKMWQSVLPLVGLLSTISSSLQTRGQEMHLVVVSVSIPPSVTGWLLLGELAICIFLLCCILPLIFHMECLLLTQVLPAHYIYQHIAVCNPPPVFFILTTFSLYNWNFYIVKWIDVFSRKKYTDFLQLQ